MTTIFVLMLTICASDGDKGVRCAEHPRSGHETLAACQEAGRALAGRRWRCVRREAPRS